MAQIKKINIKGVEYDIAGSGSSTTDTAYVDDKTLYIEEGTTAGGSSGITYLNIEDLTEVPEEYRDVEKLKNCFLTTGGMIYTPDNVMSSGSDSWEVFYSSFYEGTYWWVGIDETGKIRQGCSTLISKNELDNKISVTTNSDGTVDLIIN